MAGSNREWRAESLGPARELALPQGAVRYHSVGSGPAIVFVHGALVNANLWRKVVAELSADFRCVTLDLPFGSHVVPMPPDADLSPPAVGRPDRRRDRGARARRRHARRQRHRRRDLPDRRHPAPGAHRRARADLVRRVRQLPAEGAAAAHAAALAAPRCCGRCSRPRARAPSSARSSRRLAKRPVDPEVLDSYALPAITSAGVRRDLARFVAGIDPRHTLEAAERLPAFDRPARDRLVARGPVLPARPRRAPRRAAAAGPARVDRRRAHVLARGPAGPRAELVASVSAAVPAR